MSKPKHCSECGTVLESAAKRRSRAQHNRYFAVIAALYAHWPEFHLTTGAAIEFIPESETQLRKWLQIKAGHREVTMIEAANDDPATIKNTIRAAEAAVRAARGYAFLRPHGGGIACFTSKKIRDLGHSEFCKLSNLVDEVITLETGHDPEVLLREHQRAA